MDDFERSRTMDVDDLDAAIYDTEFGNLTETLCAESPTPARRNIRR
jgi:hypothetical protein